MPSAMIVDADWFPSRIKSLAFYPWGHGMQEQADRVSSMRFHERITAVLECVDANKRRISLKRLGGFAKVISFYLGARPGYSTAKMDALLCLPRCILESTAAWQDRFKS